MERFEGYLKTIFMGGVSVGWLVVYEERSETHARAYTTHRKIKKFLEKKILEN